MRIEEIETLYQKWLKETKRSGGVLMGSSIREFFQYLHNTQKDTKPK